MPLTKVANHKYLKFLFLFPIVLMIAFSMYFYHLTQEIDNALLHARISASQVQIAELTQTVSELTYISRWMHIGAVVLIAVTTMLNIIMVLVVKNLPKRHS